MLNNSLWVGVLKCICMSSEYHFLKLRYFIATMQNVHNVFMSEWRKRISNISYCCPWCLICQILAIMSGNRPNAFCLNSAPLWRKLFTYSRCFYNNIAQFSCYCIANTYIEMIYFKDTCVVSWNIILLVIINVTHIRLPFLCIILLGLVNQITEYRRSARILYTCILYIYSQLMFAIPSNITMYVHVSNLVYTWQCSCLYNSSSSAVARHKLYIIYTLILHHRISVDIFFICASVLPYIRHSPCLNGHRNVLL